MDLILAIGTLIVTVLVLCFILSDLPKTPKKPTEGIGICEFGPNDVLIAHCPVVLTDEQRAKVLAGIKQGMSEGLVFTEGCKLEFQVLRRTK